MTNVTTHNVIDRIKKKLAEDNLVFETARESQEARFGKYFVRHKLSGEVKYAHLEFQLEQFARELGVLEPNETLIED